MTKTTMFTYVEGLTPLTRKAQGSLVEERLYISDDYWLTGKPKSAYFASPFLQGGKGEPTVDPDTKSTCPPKDYHALKLAALGVCAPDLAYKATKEWLAAGKPASNKDAVLYPSIDGTLHPVNWFWQQTTSVIGRWKVVHENVEKKVDLEKVEQAFNDRCLKIDAMKTSDAQKEKKKLVAFEAKEEARSAINGPSGGNRSTSANKKFGNAITAMKEALNDDRLIVNEAKLPMTVSFSFTKENWRDEMKKMTDKESSLIS